MSILASLRGGPVPTTAVEIALSRVSAAAVEWRAGRPVVTAHATESLPKGALVPSLTSQNVQNRAAVVDAVGRVLDRVGRRRQIGLVVPDAVAKVSLVRFEQLPTSPRDLDQLVRWQVRKAAPFPIEEAQVSHVPGLSSPGAHELIVTLARRSVVEEYESVCAAAGAQAGIVDLATFNVVNAVLAGDRVSTGDWLVVNVTSEDASVVIMRGACPIFFRTHAVDTAGALGDLIHQAAMYHEDRLQGATFSRVVMAGGMRAAAERVADIDQLRAGLAHRLATPVETVDALSAVSLGDQVSTGPGVIESLAPLVGLLLREQEPVA